MMPPKWQPFQPRKQTRVDLSRQFLTLSSFVAYHAWSKNQPPHFPVHTVAFLLASVLTNSNLLISVSLNHVRANITKKWIDEINRHANIRHGAFDNCQIYLRTRTFPMETKKRDFSINYSLGTVTPGLPIIQFSPLFCV